MDWKYLLTSFDGRINRAKFWAAVGVFIALGVIGLILDIVLGTRITLGGGGQLGHHRRDHSLASIYFALGGLCQTLARPRQVGLVDADQPGAVHRRHLVHRRMRHSRRHQGRQQIRTGSACLTETAHLALLQPQGRISPAVYFLAGLLVFIVQAFPLYRFTLVPPESAAAQGWALASVSRPCIVSALVEHRADG